MMTKPINTLNEKPLHAALKAWYARPEDEVEVPVDGYMIDLVQGGQLIEIQTRNFAGIKKKVSKLIQDHSVCLIHPIAQTKWIIKLVEDEEGEFSRRKSPKRGTVMHMFRELVHFPNLLAKLNFTLEIVLIEEEELRHYVGRRAWRKKGWQTYERRLLKVVEQHRFTTPTDLGHLLPQTLADPFTTTDLAKASGQTKNLAQKMTYCLREAGVIKSVGKRGRAILYTRED